ncbi:MAG: hypothetical protein LLG20_01025 [Acidobacteriales bacterium]|nr:hypothetical protein [Terriglobales bacterium]
MSVFTDGVIAMIGDLRSYESSILDVAHTEGIDLTAKLALAQEEVAVELEALLPRRRAGVWSGINGRPKLDNVVVTRPLKQWLIFHTLAIVYRDAYNSQLNDRYLGKRKEYSELAKWAARMLSEIGVGVVSTPIPKASEPIMSTTPGNGVAGRYYVRVAWRNAVGEEGAPGEVCVADTSDGTLLTVAPTDPPPAASGWSVYAGTSPDDITLQSVEAIGLGQQWTAPATGLVQGRKPGDGQEAETYLMVDQTLQRG